MKRKGLFIAFLFLLALLLVLASRKEVLTATGQTIVHQPANDLITGFGDTSFWAGFLGEVPQSVINIAPGRFVVSMPSATPSPIIVNISPSGPDSSRVLWIRKLNLSDWMKEKFGQTGPVKTALSRLKSYSEKQHKPG